MEDELTKKNLTKILSLFTLRLRKLAGQEWTGAGDLAEMAGVNRDSLYVLLGRWLKWEYVKADRFSTPRLYSLASHGSHYLDQLEKWYGNRDLAFETVCDNVKASFYWASRDQRTSQVTKLNFLTYPFREASDYSVVKPDSQGRLTYVGDSLIRIRKPNALQAVYGIRDDLKLAWGNGLIDLLVSSGFIQKNK